MDFKWLIESAKREVALTKDERMLVVSLTKEYSSWIKSLSSKEIHAIRKYTKNSLKESRKNKFYMKLNQMLEATNPSVTKNYQMLREYSDTISSALQRHRIKQEITCYRGVDTVPVENVETGEIFEYKRFISTSLFEKHAFRCKYMIKIHIPVGICAAYIDDISVYKGQFEVLIDKGYHYKLISIQGNTYELEVCSYD